MTTVIDLVLAVLAIVWWFATGWYALRLLGGRIRPTSASWHLLIMGILIASLATEELVMQRWYGGWPGHEPAVALFVLIGIYLGVDRLHILARTRPRGRRDEHRPRQDHAS